MQDLNFVERRQGTVYRVGELIPATGIYRVTHNVHRASHDVTLLIGELFPPCSRCGNEVHFSLVEAAPQIANDRNFRIHLYEIPHPIDDELQSA